MNFVHERTEEFLSIFLDQIKPKPHSWRMISIEFQDCETLNSHLFQNLCLRNINFFFGQSECRIFWIKPGFLLIFFQGRAMPIEKCVEGFLKETEFKGFGRFFDILDLSIDWENLIALITRIQSGRLKICPLANQPANKKDDISRSSEFAIHLSKDKLNQLQPIRQSRTTPLILLVEDDPFTLQLIKLTFKEGFDIITAETARQALVYYQRHLPDMVFLDIQLPDGNGINILEEITGCDNESHVVMLSSHSQKEKIIECLHKGAKGFIAKPFTRQRLIETTDKFKATKRNLHIENNRHGT